MIVICWPGLSLLHIAAKFMSLYYLATPNLQERKIVMVGLDAAGKTTVLYRLKLNEVLMTIPTIGLFGVALAIHDNPRSFPLAIIGMGQFMTVCIVCI